MKIKKGVDKFWFGLLTGFVGGLIGNLWITLWYRVDGRNLADFMLAIAATILMICFFNYLYNKAMPKRLMEK